MVSLAIADLDPGCYPLQVSAHLGSEYSTLMTFNPFIQLPQNGMRVSQLCIGAVEHVDGKTLLKLEQHQRLMSLDTYLNF